MARSRYRITDPEAPHFLTTTVNQWIPLFTRPATVDIIFQSWRYLQQQKADFLLSQFARYKKPHKTQSEYQLWQEGSHPQLMATESVLRQKLEYIHQNPVKRGYVDMPEHWRYSSARCYAGMDGLIDVVTEW